MAKSIVKNLLFGLVAAGILAAMGTMALQSRLNVHPDELDHVNAGRYFIQYWDFPALDDPRLSNTFSNYGVTYLQQLDVVYFFAGKFARIVGPFVAADYIALRFFNIFLFAVLMGLFLRLPDDRKISFLPLFITPQIWYVFSYFNGDAFPMFLSFCMVYAVARLDPPAIPGSAGENAAQTRRLLALGVLLGFVCISKQNYYVLAGFTLAFFGVCGLDAHNFKAAAKNAALVFLVAATLFGARWGYNVYVNRTVRPEVPTLNAEKYAIKDYKPSSQEAGTQFWGLRMREQGLTYPQLFSIWTWHIWTFRTSFGVYDYMKIYAPFIYYRYVGYVFWALAGALAVSLVLHGGRGGIPALLVFLIFAGLTVFQSTWHSWVNDFQAQGRYLFPIGAMAGMTLARFAKAANRTLPVTGVLAAAMLVLSLYSFLWVGLPQIPK
ncbi:hypothetical protein DVDV_4165 [Desulfovibrio sp. DV]|uniref:hypothetical protein n=1 Tax=Desulfovibrio sp. DV TaxID=1844708 RepID=UPI00094BA36F|nr:hypothetical protein [Desulfovibrio sp. DV]OLN24499.1 hypothetical protein DVDV_4165 [Desulfovibrio sp. DV]